MIFKELILAFDDSDLMMNQENGLPINKLGEVLKRLFDALEMGSETKFVLKDVQNGSYGLMFLASASGADKFKSLHEKIAVTNANLNGNEKKYASLIAELNEKDISVKAYNAEGTWDVQLNSLTIEPTVKYYYDVDEVVGIITKIGGNTLDEKPIIRINRKSYNIEITQKQEEALKQCYKRNKIAAVIRFKRNIETDKIKAAELLNYQVLQIGTLQENIEKLQKQHGALFPDIDDSVKAVRDLRID